MSRSRVSSAWPMPGCSRTVPVRRPNLRHLADGVPLPRDLPFRDADPGATRAAADRFGIPHVLPAGKGLRRRRPGAACGPVVAGSARILRPRRSDSAYDPVPRNIPHGRALIISNPLRSPLGDQLVVFSLWRLTVERGATVLQSLPPADAAVAGRGTSAAHFAARAIECPRR